jgi:hypothetical protein
LARSSVGLDKLFKGRYFERRIIILCVRCYFRFKLSFRDLVEMMAERGLTLAHTTIMRRVQGFAPEFERRWNRLPANQAIPDASMRPISRSEASGRIFTEQSTGWAGP